MAEYYNLVVLPARVRKPKDKAKVEAAVLLVERWILAALRHRHFYSLGELNEEIGVLLERLNDKKFKKLQGSRKELFEKNERPVLRALPTERYSYGEWKIAKVNIDYHIEIDRSYYSVPYKYIGRKLDVRVSSATLDIYSQMTHICSHVLALRDGSHITIKEHMPKSHQEYGHWTPERIISWAESLGEDAGLYVKKLLHSQKHPALGYRKALGIISLKKIYSSEKINQACKRANSFGANDYQTVKRILEKNLQDDTAHINKSETIPSQEHENVRGNQYYE
jgi:transposase